MKYAIIANPKAGRLNIDQKRLQLKEVSQVLNAKIYGLNTTSAGAFARRAVEVGDRCDVLVVAGGDGTFSDIINAIYPSRLSLAFLPLGTGNAIRSALAYRGGLADMAQRIRNGQRHTCDLIRCDGDRLAFMASVGLDGTAVKLWTRYRKQGVSGPKAYFLASLKAYLSVYRPSRVDLIIDDTHITVKKLLSLVVVKQPYFGMGMKVVPRARWDDGHLHALWMSAKWHQPMIGVATSFTFGNRAGTYRTGKTLQVQSERPLTLQMDGELGRTRQSFSFEVLPGVLSLTH